MSPHFKNMDSESQELLGEIDRLEKIIKKEVSVDFLLKLKKATFALTVGDIYKRVMQAIIEDILNKQGANKQSIK